MNAFVAVTDNAWLRRLICRVALAGGTWPPPTLRVVLLSVLLLG